MQQVSSRQVAWPMAEGDREGMRDSLTLVASLLLLGVSYLLLLAAPVVAERMHVLVERALPIDGLQRWIPTAAGAGLALGGGSALVFVLSRLVRDMERRPYASLAPALGVFCGALLVGLRAKLPLPGVASEHLAVFALVLAVLGGALVQERSVTHRMLGIGLALMPSVSLVLTVWALSERQGLGAAIWELSSAGRAYLALLGGGTSAMIILGLATSGAAARLASASTTLDPALPEPSPYVSQGAYMGLPSIQVQRDPAFEGSWDEDERRLRKRPIPRWALAAVPVAVLGGVALSVFSGGKDSQSTAVEVSGAQEAAVAAPSVGDGPAQAPRLGPTVEPLAPPSAAPAVAAAAEPSTASARVEEPEAKAQDTSVEERPQGARQNDVHATHTLTLPESVLDVPAASRAKAPAPPKKPAKLAAKTVRTQAAAKPSAGTKPPPFAPVAPAKEVREKPAAPEPKVAKAEAVAEAPAKKEAPKKPEAPAKPAAPEDDSLEALLDRAVDSTKKVKGKNQNTQDDPIFGL